MSATADRRPAVTARRLLLANRVAQLRADGLRYIDIAEELGISRSQASMLAIDPDGSKQLARRARYRGVCERCGEPTDGSNGRSNAPKHCSDCSQALQHESRRWTADAVVEAIRRWNTEHGRPPKAPDWNHSGRPDWAPSINAVARYGGWANAPFATWADAIEAAGFPRPHVGKRDGQRHWTRESIGEEMHARSVDGFVSSTCNDGFHSTVVHHFGSWAAGCAAAGLRPASERRAREPEAV